jgi:hypothetical protein
MISSLSSLGPVLAEVVQDQLGADDDHHSRPEVEDDLVADDLEVSEQQDAAEYDEQDSPKNLWTG